jgi:hypothetical protein
VGKVMGFDEQHDSYRLSKLVSTWEWRDPKDTQSASFAMPGSIWRTANQKVSRSCTKAVQDCRGIWASIPAAW